MINSRLISDLSLNGQAWFSRFKVHVESELWLIFGIDWGVCRTKCDREFQAWLYAQGRTRPGDIVTWTLDSRHIHGEAWDIFILENGKAIWVSPKYGQIAEVGLRMGLVCGYFWKGKKTDPGHYQTPEVVG